MSGALAGLGVAVLALVGALGGPAWVVVASAVVALIGAIAAVVFHLLERQAEQAEGAGHATALRVMLTRSGPRASLLLYNTGTHAVSKVKVQAYPTRWELDHPVPALDLAATPFTTPAEGMWFATEISQLSEGEGDPLAEYTDDPDSFQRMFVGVSWDDHTGARRKVGAVVDLRECASATELPLAPER